MAEAQVTSSTVISSEKSSTITSVKGDVKDRPQLMSEKVMSSFVDNPNKVYNPRSYASHLVASQMKVADQCSDLKRHLAQTERELQELQHFMTMSGFMRKNVRVPVDFENIDSD